MKKNISTTALQKYSCSNFNAPLKLLSFKMPISKKYILIAGDDIVNLSALQQLFAIQQPNTEIVVVDNPGEILQQVQKFKPLIIILYLPHTENQFTAYIKELRDNSAADEIPVYIYSALPGAGVIKEILNKSL